MKGWAWVLFWCCGGLGLLSAAPHLLQHGHQSHSVTRAPGLVISGDAVSGNYEVQGTGDQRDVSISGDHDGITLRGNVRNLTVNGDYNAVQVVGSVESVQVDNDGNTVRWTKEPPGKTVQPVVSGDGNHVGLTSR